MHKRVLKIVRAVPCRDIALAERIASFAYPATLQSPINVFLQHFSADFLTAPPIIFAGTFRDIAYVIELLIKHCIGKRNLPEFLLHCKWRGWDGNLYDMTAKQIHDACRFSTIPNANLSRLNSELRDSLRNASPLSYSLDHHSTISRYT